MAAPVLVGVFGSFARGDGGADSDIEVLVVAEAVTDDNTVARDLAATVQRWTGNPCHVVVVTPSDRERMRRAGEPILVSWRRDLVVVMGERATVSA